MSLSSSVRLLFWGSGHFLSTARLCMSSSLFPREETRHWWVEGLKYFGNLPGITSFLPQSDCLMDEASKCALQIRGFFWFWNSGSLRLQKFFHSVLKCPSEGKQKKERSGRFLDLFKQFAIEQKFTMTFANFEHFNLQWRQWMHLYFLFSQRSSEPRLHASTQFSGARVQEFWKDPIWPYMTYLLGRLPLAW